MTSDRWQQVTELFEAACARPAAERDAWLAQACPDEGILTEVRTLLASYEEEPGFLERPATAETAAGVLHERMDRAVAGRRIGAYRVVRELGRGGMGVVYEAVRDDQEFARRVAIKLLPAGWIGSSLVARFRQERRVLATLDHQGIARLYDAGTTDDGVPYFVMEYVDGRPVDAWCRSRALPVRRRIALVLQVCDAIGHAHQNLVVHRDLKPANILVTAEGRPKLLDFGIAKVLSEEAADSPDLTRTGQRAFTAEYASPEQIKGLPITTASDVYSLGVLLYVLLAGRPPHDLGRLSPFDAMKAVCELDPPPPSRVARAEDRSLLAGDLDTVIMRALRKAPQERYPSVFAFADDLRAWLEGRPVSASASTAWYRARKLVMRHKARALAVAAVVLALVGGGVATAWQAHIARLERDKAQHRFRQVREFSRSLLFEVHEALRRLPGATEPRRLLLDRAVGFLDGLAADAGEDDPLTLELAQGYRRLGQVLGSSVSENVGDLAGAQASFEKAARLSEDVLARHPDSLEAANVATGAYDDLAGVLRSRELVEDAERANERHRVLTEDIERRHGNDPRGMSSVAASYLNLGVFRGTRGDHDGARPLYEKAIRLYSALPPDMRAADDVIKGHNRALKRLGAILIVEDQLEEAERRYREALALEEALLARHPEDASIRYDMTFTQSDLGLIARKRGDLATALELYGRAREIRAAAVAADPKNVRALIGLASTHSNLGGVLYNSLRYDEALSHHREGLRRRRAILDIVGPTSANVDEYAWARFRVARTLLDAASDSPPLRSRAMQAEARTLLTALRSEIPRLSGNAAAKTGELSKNIDAELARLPH
jgi:non-specific serine/threonine protein kinase/serine/threonine-protein kinase